MHIKIVLALISVLALAAADERAKAPPAVNPWIPPWLSSAPWYPQWAPCNFVGVTCQDCSTRMICTKIGAIQKACTDPTLPHCNMGECSATPTVECAPAETPNAV